MNNKRELIVPLMEGMNNFYKLMKVLSKERYKSEKVLTEKQFFALVEMKKYEKIELKNLSKDLNVSNSSLCILLNKLVDQGYVYREEDSNDRRNTFYALTEEGKIVTNEEIERFIEIIEAKVEVLEESKQNILLTALDDVNSIMKELI